MRYLSKRLSAFSHDNFRWEAVFIPVSFIDIFLRKYGTEYWVIPVDLIGFFLIFLFFGRDGFTGRSQGKKFQNIIVTHNGLPVKPIRAMLRNMATLFLIFDLAPLPFIGKRTADIILKTEITDCSENTKLSYNKNNWWLVISLTLVFTAVVHIIW